MPCRDASEKTPACQLRAGPIALAVVGISHQTSTIEEREPLQLGRDELPQVDSSLVSLPGVHEATAICTCNRIEFYLVLRDAGAAGDVVAQMYRERRNLDLSSLRDTLYERVDGDAVRHLLRVAAGVDSMVLGETQIFGQIKQAYTQACSVKSAGKILHRLFHQAFRTGKRVRELTTIGQGSISVGSLAARVVKEQVSADIDPVILFVGVNEMVSIAAEHLHKAGYRRFVFANRTPEHAAQLAKAYGVEAHALADLGRLLDAADVTLACTGAATPLITCALLNGERAGGTPRLLIDLGVPRDIEPEAGALPGVTLLDLDDLKSKLSVNLDRRMNAIASAEEIIERKLAEFSYWYEAVRLEPIYNGLADAFESIRREELTTVDGDCPPEWRKVLDRFSVRLARRLLQAASRPRGE